MYLDKLIKREFLVLIVSVITITIIIFAVFYMNNSNMNNKKNNIITIDNLEIKYCEDLTCKKTYSNFGSVIGTRIVDGKTKISPIKKYDFENDALDEKPYVINIKNTSDAPSYISLFIKEDEDYREHSNMEEFIKITNLYTNNLKIAISNCTSGINKEESNIYTYNELNNYLLLDNDTIQANSSNTYCLWTWISNLEEELDNSYFVAKIDFKSKTIK